MTFSTIQDAVKKIEKYKLSDEVTDAHKGIAKKYADWYDSMVYSMIKMYNIDPKRIYLHKEVINDFENNRFKVIIKPRMTGKSAYFGVDLGREEKMCYEGEQRPSYREIELAEANKELKKNHLGAPTERFIELARENGRSEHLGNTVREQEQKIYELSQALMRANEQVAYSDNETQKASNRAQAWQERAIKAENLYYGLREKNRAAAKKAKKPVAKKK